ncbi:hypothetical protein OCU04_004540 [Sclerotinia nivalis]|uniref:Uncharacterized protein n=1 Tax=Sclerotinia nivalis TaxID=352851 RepID=A0A9X0DNL9_9HELO|nr:hypothetical protein OCU04_004540 [Sclerotinia nivalis]
MSVRISQEVLMSHRLLFGSMRSSQTVAKLVLKKLKDEEPYCDKLLDTLRTNPVDSKINALPPSRAAILVTHYKKLTHIALRMIFPCMANISRSSKSLVRDSNRANYEICG